MATQEMTHFQLTALPIAKNRALCANVVPVLVVVAAGEVDEHELPPPVRLRLLHRLPGEGERGLDRPAATSVSLSPGIIYGGKFTLTCGAPAPAWRGPP